MDRYVVRILALVLIVPGLWGPVEAQEAKDFLRFPDGVEVFAPSGRLQAADVAAALGRVEAQISRGELRLAKRMLDLVQTRARDPVPEVQALRARIREVEFSSVIILRDGQRIEGRLVGPFRADHLGLETKRDISPDEVRRISAEYHLGWSRVSHTFYPLAVIETEFKDGRTLLGRLTQETPVTLETRDGRLVKVMMGRPYQLFREKGVTKQLLEGDGHRVARILVQTALNPSAP
ncbi:MAG: hypothetical protein ACE5EW_00360 [Thermoplasmata archaeon]